MRSLMLLHVVFAGEGLVAYWAVDALFTGVLLTVAGGVARSGKRCVAVVGSGVGARVLVLLRWWIGVGAS